MEQTVGKNNQTDGLWGFVITTFILMLSTWGVLAFFQMSVANTTNQEASTSALAMILYLVGGFTPSIAGFIMAYRQEGRAGLHDLWKRFTRFNLGIKWYLTIIGITLSVQAGVALIFKLQGGQFVQSELLNQPTAWLAIIIPVFIGGPLSEEFGWRGFAQDRVQARWGFLKGSVLLGLIWAFWHLPLFFVEGSGQQQAGSPLVIFPAYAVWVVSMTILFSWVYKHTHRSIWGVMLFHFMINFSAVLLLEIAAITPRFLYLTSSGMWFLLVLVFLFFRNKRNMGKRQ